MKKLVLFFVIVISLSFVASAQETAKKVSPISFAGGLIVSANKSVSFIGFVGPKVSATFNVVKNLKAEVGVNAFPGLIFLKAETKPGLAVGGTVTLKNNNWKLKPVVGITLLKTKDWEPMFGVGFVF